MDAGSSKSIRRMPGASVTPASAAAAVPRKPRRVLSLMASMSPTWMEGGRLRPCHFQPTFHKFTGELCAGFQIHLDDAAYRHDRFRPYRLMALCLKAIRRWRSDYPLWRDFAYEYETDRLAIDVISGGPELRAWVDDPSATAADFEAVLAPDETAWSESRLPHLLYPA